MCIMFGRFLCFFSTNFCLAGGFSAVFCFRTKKILLVQTHFIDSNNLNLHELVALVLTFFASHFKTSYRSSMLTDAKTCCFS